MPGLRLTATQVQRLCGIDADICQPILDALVDVRFLRRNPNGTYARLTAGAHQLADVSLPVRQASVVRDDLISNEQATTSNGRSTAAPSAVRRRDESLTRLAERLDRSRGTIAAMGRRLVDMHSRIAAGGERLKRDDERARRVQQLMMKSPPDMLT